MAVDLSFSSSFNGLNVLGLDDPNSPFAAARATKEKKGDESGAAGESRQLTGDPYIDMLILKGEQQNALQDTTLRLADRQRALTQAEVDFANSAQNGGQVDGTALGNLRYAVTVDQGVAQSQAQGLSDLSDAASRLLDNYGQMSDTNIENTGR